MQWCKMRENNRAEETINGEKKREREKRKGTKTGEEYEI